MPSAITRGIATTTRFGWCRSSADGSSVTDTYDERGNLVERKGPGSACWQMRYDDDDRLVEAIDAAGGNWRYAYDGGGRLTRVEDPLGHVVRLEYENGRLTRIVDPLGLETRTTLDAEGRVLEIALPGRGATKFEYDELGRLSSVSAASGERIAWSYDPLCRPVAVETHGELVRFDRDGEGRITAVHRTATSTRVRRDALGSIEALQTGDVVVGFTNDSEGRLVSVHRDDALLLSVQRDPRGLVAAYTNGEDEPTLVLRKAKTRRIEYLVERRGATRIEWDDAGRIVAIERPDGRHPALLVARRWSAARRDRRRRRVHRRPQRSRGRAPTARRCDHDRHGDCRSRRPPSRARRRGRRRRSPADLVSARRRRRARAHRSGGGLGPRPARRAWARWLPADRVRARRPRDRT